jgi:hypothetical protein
MEKIASSSICSSRMRPEYRTNANPPPVRGDRRARRFGAARRELAPPAAAIDTAQACTVGADLEDPIGPTLAAPVKCDEAAVWREVGEVVAVRGRAAT